MMRARVLLAVGGAMALSGCVYFSEREFGDYYNTTKWCWSHGYISPGRQAPETHSLGQCIGGSGYYLLGIGALATEPVGWAVHTVETFTLAPVYDTLMLPVDWWCRPDTSERDAAEEAIETDNQRMLEEWRRREEMARRDRFGGDVTVKPAPSAE